MDKFKKVVNYEFVISGRVAILFKEWIKTTKLSKQKLKILRLINKEDWTNLQSISDETGMSLPLISYHINGNLKNDGLEKTELVQKKDIGKGLVGVRLSEFGALILDVVEGEL